MVRFLAPLLGIVAGLQVVPLELGPEVASFVARLDGVVVERGDRDEPRVELALESGPRTHRLEVVGFDADGAETGRAIQWINRPEAGVGVRPSGRTPVAVVIEDSALDSGELRNGFRIADEPASPLAFGGGGSHVVFVIDPSSRRALEKLAEDLGEELERTRHRLGERDRSEGLERLLLPRGTGEEVTLLWTSALEAGEGPSAGYDLFAMSPLYGESGESGLSWLLARIEPPPLPERVADAVCVAGWLAASRPRPRAVVLLTDPRTADGSTFRPDAARRYLSDLNVPFHVWTTSGETGDLSDRWGAVEVVATWDRLASAIRRLREELDRQRIVWLEGDYLEREVSLAPRLKGVSIAGAVEEAE